MKDVVVSKDSKLLEYLINDLNINRKEAKRLLANKIKVNDTLTSKFDYSIHKGDNLSFNNKVTSDLDIIYEDNNFIAINKPSGLLSISTDKENTKTAYHLVREYVKSIDKHNKIFILHRIDKDTSGVLVFCKNEKLRDALQDKWNDIVLKRGYYAIIEGKLDKKEDTIINYLKENKIGLVYSTTSDNKYAKKAITTYKVIKEGKDYSLLDIDIKTGRKNQIRVTLSDLNHPIIGDKNYGGKKGDRLYLHAYELSFKNPIDKKIYKFIANKPNSFNKY